MGSGSSRVSRKYEAAADSDNEKGKRWGLSLRRETSNNQVPAGSGSASHRDAMAEAHAQKQVKVLLLGAGETGKSTILKQLALQYGKREHIDLTLFKSWLIRNATISIQQLLSAAEHFEIQCDEELSTLVSALEPDAAKMSTEEATAVYELWSSEPIQRALDANRKQPTQWVLDQTPYYLNNLQTFVADDFVPTDEDVLKARTLTMGIKTVEFSDKVDPAYLMSYMPLEQATSLITQQEDRVFAELKWMLIDVGGQRNERRKWLHCLDDVLCLMWTVGLVEYQQVLYEEPDRVRILESLDLFSKWANNKQFQHMPIMLIFTKLDLFEATYDEERFREVFPRFTGPKNTGQNAAVRFLVKEFKSRLELRPQSSQVLTYTLDTTDPNDFEDMLHALRALVARHNADFIKKAVSTAARTAAKR
mmetsp:Transcript_64250/g.171368  ORF Transcript_64250/g.171368 Transcript_64250/m.171368 type:complete len:420 (-) Transcript_64250:129-1388(-)